jgi:Xaa-Pro dipeptidase
MTESLTQIPDGAQTKIYTWNEDEDPYALLVKHLPPGMLGLDERVQFVFANRIQLADPSRKLVSAIPVISGCREIKSPAELALMQLANNITLAVYKAAWQSAGPGMTNEDFSNLCTLGYKQSGVQGETSCQVGEWSALPHGSPRPQTIREGQVVLIDDGCLVHGYQSDMSRSFVYGKPSDKQLKVFEIVHRAQAAALAAAKPGLPCHAIDDAARQVVTAAGFGPDYKTFSHRVGHGIGMDMHEWPYLVRGNQTPLAAGMCFSDEPGIYLPGAGGDPDAFGIRLEDDWHLTETGGIMFTPQSPSLEHPFA